MRYHFGPQDFKDVEVQKAERPKGRRLDQPTGLFVDLAAYGLFIRLAGLSAAPGMTCVSFGVSQTTICPLTNTKQRTDVTRWSGSVALPR